MRFRPTVLTVAAVTAAVPVAAGCGASDHTSSAATPSQRATTGAPSAPANASGPIDVKLSEWAVTPSRDTAKAGKVTFRVTNDGKAPHEMVVIRTGKKASDLGSGARISEKGSVGEAGEMPAGASKTVTLKLKKGHYALICNVSGHYMSGMHADFTVS